jgi:phosphomevalonate kinase
MTVSVPGNLLLAGEYLVLEEGGPGVALALEPRAYASAEPAASWSIEAVMGVGSVSGGKPAPRWAPGHGAELHLAEAVFQAAAALWRQEGIEARPQAIVLDSSAFFDAAGRKAGFGSSAASAVALALTLGKAAGLEGSALKGFALKAALRGHRLAQGGRGSGYDVYASAHGGIGLFIGGAEPSWQDLPAIKLPPALLFAGPAPVSSARAVGLYDEWRVGPSSGPGVSQTLLERSRRSVLALARARDPGEALGALAEARLAGLALGEALGVPAQLEAPPGLSKAAGLDPVLVKASGAGNELGMAFFRGRAVAADGFKELKATEGPLWLT